MTAYSVFPYLVYLATNVARNGPLAMDIASLPWKNLMITVINETVLNYARSRANQILTNAPLENLDKEQATVQIVDLDQDLLKEPTHITQAPTIQESLAMISESWKVQTA